MAPRSVLRDIEVRADAVTLFIAAFDVFPSLGQKYLVQHGVAEALRDGKLRPVGDFLPLRQWLDTFDAILADIGPTALFKIGQRIIDNPHVAGDARDLDGALKAIDVAFHMSHRKNGVVMFDRSSSRMIEGIGHYAVRGGRAEKVFQIACDTPYPCPLEHGIISGIAGQFEPRAIVTHAGSRPCRMNGGAECTYLVTW